MRPLGRVREGEGVERGTVLVIGLCGELPLLDISGVNEIYEEIRLLAEK